MEENIGVAQKGRLPAVRNRDPVAVGEFHGPAGKQAGVGVELAVETVRHPRPGRHQVVRHPEIHRQVPPPAPRTQNMIKNRFYGTLRNFVRFLVNHLGGRRESFNRRISRLSPKVLNDIYKAEHRNTPPMQSSSSSAMRSRKPYTRCGSRSIK